MLIAAIGVVVAAQAFGGALPWPLSPGNSSHAVSYVYGAWQNMWRQDLSRIVNYFHNGIDIPGDTAETVYAVESGYVKAILTIFASDYHWRIVIADSAGTAPCEGWLYAHIIPGSMPFAVGDYVHAGDSLGVLVTWPYPNTLVHLHLSRVKFAGDADTWANGFWDYEFTANPLEYIDPPGDAAPPVMENAWGDRLFAICANETNAYFDAGEIVSGDVDIICSAYDYFVNRQYRTGPHKLEYRIDGDSSVPWTVAFTFDGSLDSYNGDMEALSHVVYKYDTHCSTTFADSLRAFYILTNTDGDGVPEVADRYHGWPTTSFHNGEYTIYARISDFDGNSCVDSMTITVRNIFALTGIVGLEGIDPNLGGTQITVLPDDQGTVTTAGGAYSLPEVGGGYQTVRLSRPGYVAIDTLLLFDRNRQLDVTLVLDDFICGDANHDGTVNIGDAVYVINYIFKGGAAPVPLEAGDANCDGSRNVGDAVYIINYIFKGGAAPCCP